MIEIIQTTVFQHWIKHLKDREAKAIIHSRVLKLVHGVNLDIRTVGDGINELRVHYDPGYRLYFLKRGSALVILLCGGNKDSQTRDIRTAKRLAQQWRKQHA